MDGSVDPARDIETINLELIFADLEVIEKRIAKGVKGAANNKTLAKEVALLNKLKELLEAGKLAKSFKTDDEEEQAMFDSFGLLTAKPVIFAANVKEDDLADDGASNPNVQAVRNFDLGVEKSGLEKLIVACYDLLGLMSFLTAGPKESRAWTIKKGTKAPQAAGKIHSDFERGFIRAEVVNYDNLIACGGYNQAKEKGLVRSEGKEYVVQDGDVILFRFNV